MNHSGWKVSSENETNFHVSPFINGSMISPSDSSVVKKTFDFEVLITCAFLPVLFIIGIFGNISTDIVFSRKRKKNASTYFIIGLAFSDLLVLAFRMIANVYSISHLYFTEYIRYVRPNSLVWTVFSILAQRSGNLFIIFIGLERFTAVWFPLKLQQIWTAKRARIIIGVIILITLSDISLAVDTLIFSLNERIPDHGIVSTQAEAKRYIRSQNRVISRWSFVQRISVDFVPLLLVVIFNVAIIIGVKRSSISMKKLDIQMQQRRVKDGKTTRMLLGISVLFVFLSSPFVIYVNLVTEQIIVGTYVPSEVYETFKLLNVINSVVNFVIYGINDKSLRGKYAMLWKCKKDTT